MLFIYSDKAIVVIYTTGSRAAALHRQRRPPVPLAPLLNPRPFWSFKKYVARRHSSLSRTQVGVVSRPYISSPLLPVDRFTSSLIITSPSISCIRRVSSPPSFDRFPNLQLFSVIFSLGMFQNPPSFPLGCVAIPAATSTANDNNSGNKQSSPVAQNLGPYTTLS